MLLDNEAAVIYGGATARALAGEGARVFLIGRGGAVANLTGGMSADEPRPQLGCGRDRRIDRSAPWNS